MASTRTVVGVLAQCFTLFIIAASAFAKELGYNDKALNSKPDLSYPIHVHLSYGETETEMVVTWTTFSRTNHSVAEYGAGALGLVNKAFGKMSVFVDEGKEKRVYYIHRVTMVKLVPGAAYGYHVGSDRGWSDIFFFRNRYENPMWAPWIGVYGDLGNVNAQSLARLQEEVAHRTLDVIFHVGDFAYNMDDDGGRVGDSFMDQIQSIAAYVPYMTCVGNHESAYNFSHYKNRFTMPGGDGENIFYSFNLGQAHIIAFSTEVYYYLEYGYDQIATQYNWLVQDLKKANMPENRARYPWLITMGHRPMYCDVDDKDDCNYMQDKVRVRLERLFYENGVDLMLWAHEHSYERLWPVYNGKVCNGSGSAPYTNPPAPVHIVTGSAGCQEKHDPLFHNKTFIAYNALDYGYTRMKVINRTHLYLEQVSDDQGGKIIDAVTVIKSEHGPGRYTCDNM